MPYKWEKVTDYIIGKYLFSAWIGRFFELRNSWKG
jgi:hypothetical protein